VPPRIRAATTAPVTSAPEWALDNLTKWALASESLKRKRLHFNALDALESVGAFRDFPRSEIEHRLELMPTDTIDRAHLSQ
jgi:hypothetical protein